MLSIACALTLTTAADAGLGERVAVATDQGRYTSASVFDSSRENPRRWALRVRMSPPVPTKIDWDVYCFKGERSRSTESHPTVNPPAVARVKPNIRGAEDCTVSAFVDGGDGKLQVELFAR